MIGSDIRYAWRALTHQKLGSAIVVAMLGAPEVQAGRHGSRCSRRSTAWPSTDFDTRDRIGRLTLFNETAPRDLCDYGTIVSTLGAAVSLLLIVACGTWPQ